MGWGICNDCVTGEPRFIQAIRHSSILDLLQCFTECASDPREPGAHWTLSLQTALHPYRKEEHSLQGSLHFCMSLWPSACPLGSLHTCVPGSVPSVMKKVAPEEKKRFLKFFASHCQGIHEARTQNDSILRYTVILPNTLLKFFGAVLS